MTTLRIDRPRSGSGRGREQAGGTRFPRTGRYGIVLATALAIAVSTGAAAAANTGHPGGSLAEGQLRTTAAPPLAKTVGAAEVGFSLGLLRELAATTDPDGTSNVLVSPSSLATALAMLDLGARGTTEKEIAETLGTTGLSPADQGEGWRALTALLRSETSGKGSDLSRKPELNVANSVWVEEHFPVLSAYIDGLAADFGTPLRRVDFAHHLQAATAAINAWAKESTKGLIPRLFSPGVLKRSTLLVLADAVYFHAYWAQPFAKATEKKIFRLSGGGAEDVPFMVTTANKPLKVMYAPASPSSGCVAVEIPYAGRHLSALVLMPTAASLTDFLSKLSASKLGQVVRALRQEPVDLSMPTFTLRSDYLLSGALSALGMPDAFGPQADLTGIATYPPLLVNAIEQHAYLQVTPKGTTAAAATGIGVGVAVSLPVAQVTIDHPFLFLLRDDTTGTVLFESMVENPAS